MAHHTIWYYGYREFPLGGWVGRIQLPLWELEGPVPSKMKVYTGSAGDAYGAMIAFDWQTVTLLLQAFEKNLVFQLSRDGSTYEDEVEVDPALDFGSWFHRYGAMGFRVKNKTAGQVGNYQVIAYGL